MKQVIEVKRREGKPSQVVVGDVINSLDNYLPEGKRVIIITDGNVHRRYKEIINRYDYCLIGLGETIKTMTTVNKLYAELLERGADRTTFIVGIGGGIVTDITGFVASTYMRGLRFGFVATTLLAQVDSSVGGKTAIDLAAGKNLAGAFWQPSVVIADVGCLATLTPEQFADGCGEVVKHAVIADPELFAELEKTPLTLELLNRDVARVALIIARNIDIKRAVVVADERETNQRKLLNFGHSAGHAVEACEHFELGHGNCVSIGMGIITRAAALHGVCDAALPGRIEELCARHGLKTRCELSADAVFAEALHDKKRAGDTIDLVIPHGIGRCSIDRTPLSTFHELIAEGLGQKGDASAC